MSSYVLTLLLTFSDIMIVVTNRDIQGLLATCDRSGYSFYFCQILI